MKRIALITTIIPFMLLAGCDKERDRDEPVSNIKGFNLELSDSERDNTTKADPPAFSVNTSLDPTYNNINKRADNGWLLDVSILFSNNETNDNKVYESTCTYDSDEKMWVPNSNDDIRFPNYTMRYLEATLYPQGWNANTPVKMDQSLENDLFMQDILEQPGTQNINPAHILNVKVQHRYSMLDFIINDVNQDDIASITVETVEGGSVKEYIPYKVGRGDAAEYFVILPLGIAKPKVTLKTKEGITYYQTLNISSTKKNICYCVDFTGLELVLITIDIVNWVNGEAQYGYYTTPTSYPTFKGPAGETATLEYDTGVTQEITFNSEGEVTVKPFGRTIVSVIYKGGNLLEGKDPIILNSMIVNLTALFP